MNELTKYLADVEFSNFLVARHPQHARAISAYLATPNCARCRGELEEATPELVAALPDTIAAFRERYSREPRSAAAAQGKTPFKGTKVIAGAQEFKQCVREMAALHTWTTMTTATQRDGTWLVTFS